jgi:hypothetical protein
MIFSDWKMSLSKGDAPLDLLLAVITPIL